MRRFAPFTLLLLTLFLFGCANWDVFLDPEQTQQGASPVFTAESFGDLDLALLLDPDITTLAQDTKTKLKKEELFGRRMANQKRLVRAYKAFYSKPEEEWKLRRNRIQDQIISFSNQRCSEYKLMIKRFDKNANFTLGLITTFSAGLSTIFADDEAARVLSGISTISSGTRSQFNEVYIKETTKHLFTRGFELRRADLLKDIRKNQKTKVAHYTMESAIADVIQYHDACNIATGLEYLSVSQAGD